MDRQFAEAARRIAQAAVPEIDAELAEITGGAVTAINQIQRLLAWLHQQGFPAKTSDRKAIERQLDKGDLPPAVRRVLELRLGGAQAAVKKIDALLARVGADNRVRGRVSLPRCRHRPLGRRRIPAAELKATGRRRYRCRHRCRHHRRL